MFYVVAVSTASTSARLTSNLVYNGVMDGNFRVGLEDNLFVKRRVLGTNEDLVKKGVQIAEMFEREIATPNEVRSMLSLKRANGS